VNGVVYFLCVGEVELISAWFYFCQDFKQCNFLVIQLLAWSSSLYVSGYKPYHIS